jgi:PHD/YefM family antitoxin component YafN of YafNO toxin-antitoxin module
MDIQRLNPRLNLCLPQVNSTFKSSKERIMRTITLKTAKPMVLISVEEYESLRETLELLSQHPNLPEELERIRAEMNQGKSISFKDLKKKHGVR